MEPEYNQLTKEEYEVIQEKMNKILDEYNCDMLVQSTIQILKRTESKEIPSPYAVNNGEENKDNTESTPEEGGKSGS